MKFGSFNLNEELDLASLDLREFELDKFGMGVIQIWKVQIHR